MAVDFKKYIESTGTHYISNSGHDENNRYNSGTAGDQTGKEWELKAWYNRPWTVVLRYPDSAVGLKIAELGIAAALNNKIGYDQYQRTSYWNELQKVGYDPSKIVVACEEDCTAGVTANCKAVGYLMNIAGLKNLSVDTYSGNMRSRFVSAGFKALTASKYLTSPNYLLPGDILLYEGHHAATNISYGNKVEKSEYIPTELVDNTDDEKIDAEYSYVEVTRGNYYIRTGPATTYAPINVAHNGDRLEYLEEIVNGWYKIDYFGDVCYISTKCGEAVIVPKKEYKIVRYGSWNIRKGPSTSYSKIGIVTSGERLEYTGDAENNWYKIIKGGITGWVSGKAF